MIRILTILLIFILISSPTFAFSVKDFLADFRDIYSGISGADITDTFTLNLNICTQGQLRCNTETECSGFSCVMKCQDNQWIEYQYCAEYCSGGLCIQDAIQTQTFNQNDQQQLCSDGTSINQCSTNKPYFCSNGNLVEDCNTCGCPSGKTCNNNQCLQGVEGPYNPGGQEGNIEDNRDLMNTPPMIISAGEKILKKGDSITFKIDAMDRDNDLLIYKIDSAPEIVRCSISSAEVTCNGNNPGEDILRISVSDGKAEAKQDIRIRVLNILSSGLKEGVAAGLVNTPPVSDAGSDIVSIPGSMVILDASLSFDKEGLLSAEDTYKWYEDNNLIGKGKIIQKSFALGEHIVRLIVADSEGLTSEDEVNVAIKEKTACRNTRTVYYPEDTACNGKWPTKEGSEIKINSLTEGSCSLFEVCSDEVDPVIEDSIRCCTGKDLSDGRKISTCNFAKDNSETLRNCQAVYIIKSLGGEAVYMQDYFDAEMCCKGVSELCPKESYLYTPNPLPNNLKNNGLKCSNTPENNPNGYWASDTKLELNEIALFDAPAHVSLNILKTGTCVDYSVAATTLLRKIGFSGDQVMTIEASNHAYNLVRLDLDKKYTIFDMTGNNEGLKIGKVPSGYDYCENIINCYNDIGKVECPGNKEITGCENAKENIGRSTAVVGSRLKNSILSLFEKIKSEVLR